MWKAEKDDLRWVAENLTSTICRYLNSGVPSILAYNDEEHAQVVCGYLRRKNVSPQSLTDQADLDSDVTHFIVHDDQNGPYILRSIGDLAARLAADENNLSVLVPLPRGLCLDGGTAEQLGADIFGKTVVDRLRSLPEWSAEQSLTEILVKEARTQLELATQGVSVDPAAAPPEYERLLAVRSFFLSGNDFKRGFGERRPDARDIAGRVRLPKFVWIVEVMNRALRTDGKPAVIGTVVLDGSAVVKRHDEAGSVEALLIHIPGQVHLSGEKDRDEQNHWHPVSTEPRSTCRWQHKSPWLISSEAVARRLVFFSGVRVA